MSRTGENYVSVVRVMSTHSDSQGEEATSSRGKRFDVVVQSDAFLPRSLVLVAPTSTSAKPASFRPEITVEGMTTKVLVEQMGAVDVTGLGDLAGHLTPGEEWGVDSAILTVLGLN